jgi:hypothetical protein
MVGRPRLSCVRLRSSSMTCRCPPGCWSRRGVMCFGAPIAAWAALERCTCGPDMCRGTLARQGPHSLVETRAGALLMRGPGGEARVSGRVGSRMTRRIQGRRSLHARFAELLRARGTRRGNAGLLVDSLVNCAGPGPCNMRLGFLFLSQTRGLVTVSLPPSRTASRPVASSGVTAEFQESRVLLRSLVTQPRYAASCHSHSARGRTQFAGAFSRRPRPRIPLLTA